MSNCLKLVLLSIVAVAVLAACDLFGKTALDDDERIDAFLEAVNADPRDSVAIQANFHPTEVNEYSSMNTDSYWLASFFDPADRPFSVSSRSSGGAVPGYAGTTSITADISNSIGIPAPVVFGFLADPEDEDNRLIRVIDINGGTDVFQSLR